MTVVADSTPLIYLAAIGRFALLQTLYDRIIIPVAVYDAVAYPIGLLVPPPTMKLDRARET